MRVFKQINMFFCISILVFLTFSSTVSANNDEQMVDDLWNTSTEIKSDTSDEVDTTSTQMTTKNENAGFGLGDFIRAIAATAFVITLLLFLLKYINKKSRTYQSGHVIQNLGGSNLGSNKSIQMIKIGNSIYVVGVGDDVRLLKEITSKEEIDLLMKEHNQSLDQVLVPSDLFSKWIQKKKESKMESVAFTDQFKQQIEEMKINRDKVRNEIQKKVKRDDE